MRDEGSSERGWQARLCAGLLTAHTPRPSGLPVAAGDLRSPARRGRSPSPNSRPWRRGTAALRTGGRRAVGAVVGLVCWLALALAHSRAAEVHSNGSGGGAWSDPLTWRTRAVPASNDVVTVAGDDHVIVDLADPQRLACQELGVDPRGMLSFKQGAGRIVLNVDGIVESYGAIRLDMTRSEDDSAELRLASRFPQQRVLRLIRGGSIVVGGRAGLPAGRHNAVLVSRPVPATNAPAVDPTGQFEAQDGTAVDLLRADLQDLQVFAASLDNTGASPGERINIQQCRFRGRARLQLNSCDTAVIADNDFASDTNPGSAIGINGGSLIEIRGNRIRGPYDYGIVANAPDSVVLSNTVEGARTGFHAYYPNLMLKHLSVRNSYIGFHFVNFVTGVAEDCVADNCAISCFFQNVRNLQLINCRTTNLVATARPMILQNTELSLLNCAISTNAPEFEVPHPKDLSIQAWEYLVVRVQGAVPAGSTLSVVTAAPAKPLPPGAADPNVRGSPALIGADGWTPLPATMAALVVRSWGVWHDQRRVPPPEYMMKVLGPAPKPDAVPPVLKELRVTPGAWTRPNPNARQATLEVTVP